jgi:hypothetical protein
MATKEMKAILESLKNTVFIETTLTMKSALGKGREGDIQALVEAIKATF